MARMIPESPAVACESAAERRLFELLRDRTDDRVIAFHQVPWLVAGKDGLPRQGEADFVLAHPAHGVVVLEVKGGGIAYDATHDRWTSTGRGGTREITDPVAQARRSSFLLRDALRSAKGGGARNPAVGHAVAFPDTRVGDGRLRLDTPREIVVDGDDLRDLDARLDSLFRYWDGERRAEPLGTGGVSLLEHVLVNSFTLRAPLVIEWRSEQRELLELTEQQYGVLDLLARQTRVAIAGCAGSGKTFLAAEKARRLARQGFRVLVVCFNKPLAQHLRLGLADVAEIDVHNYDELCRAIVDESGLPLPEGPTSGDQGAFFQAVRELFASCCSDVAGGRYGALVVDEAQDFDSDWWLPLQLLLVDPDRSPLYVFFDDNQRIYSTRPELPVPGEPIQLTTNCRNTRRIAELVAAYYAGEVETRGPEGLPVQFHVYDEPAELLARLDDEISAWLRDAEVAPGDIALLTARAKDKSALWTVKRLGGAVLTDDPWERGKILRSSIHRFKGLERLVVAVCELDTATDQLLYVGFSRAVTYLSVYATPAVVERLPEGRVMI